MKISKKLNLLLPVKNSLISWLKITFSYQTFICVKFSCTCSHFYSHIFSILIFLNSNFVKNIQLFVTFFQTNLFCIEFCVHPGICSKPAKLTDAVFDLVSRFAYDAILIPTWCLNQFYNSLGFYDIRITKKNMTKNEVNHILG